MSDGGGGSTTIFKALRSHRGRLVRVEARLGHELQPDVSLHLPETAQDSGKTQHTDELQEVKMAVGEAKAYVLHLGNDPISNQQCAVNRGRR